MINNQWRNSKHHTSLLLELHIALSLHMVLPHQIYSTISMTDLTAVPVGAQL